MRRASYTTIGVLSALTLAEGCLLFWLSRSYDKLNEHASWNAGTLFYVSQELERSRYGRAKQTLDATLEITFRAKKQYGFHGHYWEDFDHFISLGPQFGRNVEGRYIWILRDVKDIGQYRISVDDTLNDILKKAGGASMKNDGRRLDLDYLNIVLKRRNAEGKAMVNVGKIDWSKKLGEIAPLEMIVSVEFVDLSQHIGEFGMTEQNSTSGHLRQPASPNSMDTPAAMGAAE